MLHLLERNRQSLPRSLECPLLWTSRLPDSLLIGENVEKEVLRGRALPQHHAALGTPAQRLHCPPSKVLLLQGRPQDWGLGEEQFGLKQPQGGKMGRPGRRDGPGAILGTPRRGRWVTLRITERILFCGNGTRTEWLSASTGDGVGKARDTSSGCF